MSGPKIVDIRAVRASQERQLLSLRHRLAREFSKLQRLADRFNDLSFLNKINAIRQATDFVFARIAETAPTLPFTNLLDEAQAQLAYLQETGENWLTYRAELSRSAVQRRRTRDEMIQKTARRLEEAGLEDERSQLLEKRDDATLERALQMLNDSKAAADTGLQWHISGFVRESSTQTVSDWLQQQPVEKDAVFDRLDRLAAEIDVLTELDEAERWQQEIADVYKIEDQQRRRMLIDSLVIRLSEHLNLIRIRNRHQTILDDIESLLAAFEVLPPSFIERIATLRNDLSQSPLQLRDEVLTWCECESKRIDALKSRAAILSALRNLGYDVREGMETAWSENGQIVLHVPGSSEYGVQLNSVAEDRLRTQVVRFSSANSNTTRRPRDFEVETAWCKTHDQLIHSLDQAGLQTQLLASRAPGTTEMPIVSSQLNIATHDLARPSTQERNVK